MAETPRYSETGDDVDRGSPPRMPRWVKVSAIIVGALVLVVVAIMLIGGGDHRPGRHGAGGDALPAGVTARLALLAGGH